MNRMVNPIDRETSGIEHRGTSGGECREVMVRMREGDYADLINKARKAGHTPSVYLLTRYLNPSLAQVGTEQEAMLATATKRIQNELEITRNELARAVKDNDWLRAEIKTLKNQQPVETKNTTSLSELNKTTAALLTLQSVHQKLKDSLLAVQRERDEARQQATVIAVVDPAVALNEPAQCAVPTREELTRDQVRKVRAWLKFGMDIEEAATSLGVTSQSLNAALKEPV